MEVLLLLFATLFGAGTALCVLKCTLDGLAGRPLDQQAFALGILAFITALCLVLASDMVSGGLKVDIKSTHKSKPDPNQKYMDLSGKQEEP